MKDLSVSSFKAHCLAVLDEVARTGVGVTVASVTLWEITTLYELGRIRLRLPLRGWLEAAVAPPLVECVSISPAIAAEVAVLPPTFHRDPGSDPRCQRSGASGNVAHSGCENRRRGNRHDD